MSHRYIYKLTTDDGGAPCVQDGLLSLAICKPVIRRKAELGDLIFGFAANDLHPDNRLIYLARVTEALDDGAYYQRGPYRGRADRIYKRRTDGTFLRRSDARYHRGDENLPRDLGQHPNYGNSRVLLSSDFRYFGRDCPVDLGAYPELHKFVHNVGRGHRVDYSRALEDELERFENSVWSYKNPDRPRPSQEPNPIKSHRRGSCVVIPTTASE